MRVAGTDVIPTDQQFLEQWDHHRVGEGGEHEKNRDRHEVERRSICLGAAEI